MSERQSMNPFDHDPAQALQRLTPAPLRLSPRDVWFEAGRRAGRHHLSAWRALAGAASAAAVALAVMQPGAPHDRGSIAQGPRPASIPPATTVQWTASGPSSGTSYESLRNALTQFGLSGLPAAPVTDDSDLPPSRFSALPSDVLPGPARGEREPDWRG